MSRFVKLDCHIIVPHTSTKIDNCDGGSFKGTNPERFKRWTDALTQVKAETGKMLFYSLVEWQSFDAWVWAPSIANSWRSKRCLYEPLRTAFQISLRLVYDDIQANWSRITQILNNASFIGDHSNFYAHNDLGKAHLTCSSLV